MKNLTLNDGLGYQATEVLCALIYIMLAVFLLASAMDVRGWIGMGEYKQAASSALIFAYFVNVAVRVSLVQQKILDPTVSASQFMMWCVKLALPLCRK